MRYGEFRDRWQTALRAARLLFHQDRPDETIELTTLERRWRVHLLPRPVEPFSVGATTSFRWDAFESARSYTCEEDLLTELLGRRSARSTQRRVVRVDLTLSATLSHGSTTPMPAPDVWAAWVTAVVEKLDRTLETGRRRTGTLNAWRGDLEIEGRSGPDGRFAFHGMSVSALEMIVVPRIWDDARSREREPSGGKEMDRVARRFRGALDGWTASVGELVRWLQYSPGPRRAPSRRRRSEPSLDDGDAGPETMH